MRELQRQILFHLKDRKKFNSVTGIAGHLKKDLSKVQMELDLLEVDGYVETQRVGHKNLIKKVMITPKGESLFYEGNRITDPTQIQLQLTELKEAISILEQAINAPTKEEGKSILDKSGNVINILNSGYQLIENAIHLFR